MTAHDTYQSLLAVREDLSAAETAQLDAHLGGCAVCREVAEAYAEQDRLLRELPTAPLSPAIQQDVLRRAVGGITSSNRAGAGRTIVTSMRTRLLRRPAWRVPGLAAALAALAVVLALVLHPGQSSVTPVNANDLLRAAAQASASQFPYTGTSQVSYLDVPQYTLPDSPASVVGQHRVLVHWQVQDATHYRVDIQTVLPALDAGRETVVAACAFAISSRACSTTARGPSESSRASSIR